MNMKKIACECNKTATAGHRDSAAKKLSHVSDSCLTRSGFLTSVVTRSDGLNCLLSSLLHYTLLLMCTRNDDH